MWLLSGLTFLLGLFNVVVFYPAIFNMLFEFFSGLF